MFFWLVLFIIIFYRITFHQRLAEKLIPTLFIMIAPPALGFISYIRLTGTYDMVARLLLNVALFLVQTIFGGLMAHYTVHAGEFYGMKNVPGMIPYNWAKTWHMQLPIFWIAVSWIGATIYLAPLVGGKEPKRR
jgi:nitric oxide reductase large subunit